MGGQTKFKPHEVLKLDPTLWDCLSLGETWLITCRTCHMTWKHGTAWPLGQASRQFLSSHAAHCSSEGKAVAHG